MYNEEIVESNQPVAYQHKPLFNVPSEAFYKATEQKAIKVDIIPFINKDGQPQLHQKYLLHKGVGPHKTSVSCLKQFGMDCPICSAQKAMYDGKSFGELDKETQKVVKSLYPQERSVCNIMYEGKMMVLDASEFKFLQPLQRASQSYKDLEKLAKFSYGSPTEGYSLVIQWVKKENPQGFGKAGSFFFEIETISFRPRTVQYDVRIMQKSYPLDKLMVQETTKAVGDMLYGAVPTPANDDIGVDLSNVVMPSIEHPVDYSNVGGTTYTATSAEIQQIVEAPKAAEPVCPGGGKFAVDYDDLPACDDCPIIKDCRAAYKNRRLNPV